MARYKKENDIHVLCQKFIIQRDNNQKKEKKRSKTNFFTL